MPKKDAKSSKKTLVKKTAVKKTLVKKTAAKKTPVKKITAKKEKQALKSVADIKQEVLDEEKKIAAELASKKDSSIHILLR